MNNSSAKCSILTKGSVTQLNTKLKSLFAKQTKKTHREEKFTENIVRPEELWTSLKSLGLTDTVWKVSKCGAFSGPYFLIFGLNNQSEYRKIQTRKNFFTQCEVSNWATYSIKDTNTVKFEPSDVALVFKNCFTNPVYSLKMSLLINK